MLDCVVHVSFGDSVPPEPFAGGGGVSMHRPNLKRTVIAAVFSLVVASLLLVGTAPVSAQSNSNGQGIPQQIAALEQRLTALSRQVAGLSLPNNPTGDQLSALNQQVAALGQQLAALSLSNNTIGDRLTALNQQVAALESAASGTSGAKGLRVVDANGLEIGPMISRSEVIRKIDGFWLVLSVGPAGFVDFSPLFFNDEFDCTGKLYMPDSPDLARQALVVKGTAYYSGGNPKTVGVKAYYNLFAGGGSFCTPFDQSYEQYVSEVAKADLSTFVAPFTVRYDQ
jgi:hypothetical protein